jgi:predicted Fe-S protein YdhL (DUF1289 family)
MATIKCHGCARSLDEAAVHWIRHSVALPATRLRACSTYNTWKSNLLNPETFRTAPSAWPI